MNLIVGGTGTLGSAVAERLLAGGQPVRVLTRDPAKAQHVADAGAEVVQGDLRDRASLERACKGADAVVAAAHSLMGRGAAASAHVDGRGSRDLIDAAEAAGVARFIYMSVYDYPTFRAVPFFRIKHEVEEHLKASGLAYTILRPTAFIESHAHELIGQPILEKGKVVLFGRGEQPRNFIAADDVARFVVLALRDPSLTGQTVDLGGPANHTHMDVVRLYERASDTRAKVTHVPLAIPRLASRALRRVHSGLAQVLQIVVLSDLADQSFDAGPLEERWGVELTRLEDWIAAEVGRGSAAAPIPAPQEIP